MLNRLWKTLNRKAEPLPNSAHEQSAAPDRPTPLDVTDATFAEMVLASAKLTVVDFWAEWCEPCHIMSAHVGFLAQEFEDRLLVTALDVDTNPETTGQYDVMGLPTLIFFRDGAEVERQLGVTDYAALRQKVERLLSTDSSLIAQVTGKEGIADANH